LLRLVEMPTDDQPQKPTVVTVRVEVNDLAEASRLAETIEQLRAQVLPVTLTTVTAGEQATRDRGFDVITIDATGAIYLNRELVPLDGLNAKLAELIVRTEKRRLFIAMEAQGDTDRGPLLIDLIERIRTAGIEDFAIVGQPKAEP